MFNTMYCSNSLMWNTVLIYLVKKNVKSFYIIYVLIDYSEYYILLILHLSFFLGIVSKIVKEKVNISSPIMQ